MLGRLRGCEKMKKHIVTKEKKRKLSKRVNKCCICHTENIIDLESRNGKRYDYCRRCHAVRILTHSKYYIKTYGIDSTLDLLGVKC